MFLFASLPKKKMLLASVHAVSILRIVHPNAVSTLIIHDTSSAAL